MYQEVKLEELLEEFFTNGEGKIFDSIMKTNGRIFLQNGMLGLEYLVVDEVRSEYSFLDIVEEIRDAEKIFIYIKKEE